MGVIINIIPIVIFYGFVVKGGLYIYYKILIIHKRAGVCFYIILLIIIFIIFKLLMKFVILG